MRNKASVIIWIQFTDLGGQQNYFSVWYLRRGQYASLLEQQMESGQRCLGCNPPQK